MAERLKVNQQTVRNWIDREELGAVRLGVRRIRVPKSELRRYIAESTSAARPSVAQARERYEETLRTVDEAPDHEATVVALRRLSKASSALAAALRRETPPADR